MARLSKEPPTSNQKNQILSVSSIRLIYSTEHLSDRLVRIALVLSDYPDASCYFPFPGLSLTTKTTAHLHIHM